MSVGSKRGINSEMNVVPLIDILLVLLVIFMIIPANNVGLDTEVPQQSELGPVRPAPQVVVVQVLADGSLRINEQPVGLQALRVRLEQIFKFRADHTAFVRGDAPVEFASVAEVISVMRSAGVSHVGLLTPGLENSR